MNPLILVVGAAGRGIHTMAAVRAVLTIIGLFFVLTVPHESSGQSQTEPTPGSASPQSNDSTESKSPKKDAGSKPVGTTTGQADSGKRTRAPKAQPNGNNGKADSGVANGTFENAAKETLQSLDAAIQVARKTGIAPPAGWKAANQGADAFALKRNDLQTRFNAAKDELAAAEVTSESAMALKDILNAIAANTTSQSVAESGKSDEQVVIHSGQIALAGRLPLYLAGASLVVSLLALWRSWFLAQRQIKKALTDAGLI
jgi:hypothetical protein